MAAPLCRICGRAPATYICQTCGTAVCGNCFEIANWSCTDCTSKIRSSSPGTYSPISSFSMATWLFFAAFAMIFIGMLLMVFGSLSTPSSFGGGAVILIGPIPIILGAGAYSVALIALAVVLTVFSLAVYLIMRRKTAH